MKEENPLISIIVRTKDRPELLKRALKTIAAQTYRPTEVVLVNDGGCDLDIEKLKQILRDVSLNYVRLEKNTGRAHAGNVGIENAQGQYIGFLDDDDELNPEHISTLASFLTDHSYYKVAYTDTEMITRKLSVDGKDWVEKNRGLFSKDFSYPDLLVSNYIPFNSLLFDRSIVETIGRLDEGFDLYEDWDFLIRVGEKIPFYHIQKATAIYNQWNQELQINQKDMDYTKKMHINVLRKHREKITPEMILNLWLQCVRQKEMIAEKNAVIEDKISLNPEFEHIISEKNARIAQLENTIDLIHETLGWQLLERFRRVRERLLLQGTGRRKTYDSFVKSVKYIQKNGLRRFINRVIHRHEFSESFNEKHYKIWISKNEPDHTALGSQVELSKEFKVRPKISIITPVYNPEKKVIVEMIESVIRQTYDNWELCLADASSESFVKGIIENYREEDRRIKVKYLHKNYGIARNSNEALSIATGDFIALLDHDDELAPFAFFEVVRTMNENPDVDFIYSDRDKISYEGKRFDPFFKPGWSPDYLLAQNYLCHLNVIRKTLIDEIGGFREGYDGSQDYDLVLRITEITDKIIHIPKILYHWRVVAGSAAGDSEAKPYAYDAATRALQDAVGRKGWKGIVTQGITRGLYRIKFQLNDSPKVSIVIPTKDKGEVLKKCLDSIWNKTIYKKYEIVIVDNKSLENKTFEYYHELERVPNVRLLKYDEPFNFSKINNYAVSKIDSEYVLFLNNDTEVITEEWLELMLGFAQRKETGAVGAKLLYPDGTIQTAGLILDEKGNVWRSNHRYPRNIPGYAGRILSIQDVSAVAAACMMVRTDVFYQVGGFDPQFVIAHGDIDFCLKLREKNYLIVYEPHVELYHHESLTRGYEDTREKIERLRKETELLLRKWGHVLKRGDPYLNPNIKVDNGDFSMRF